MNPDIDLIIALAIGIPGAAFACWVTEHGQSHFTENPEYVAYALLYAAIWMLVFCRRNRDIFT